MEDEIQIVYKKFKERERDRDRDEDFCRHRQSTLLDQFERLSIEIQLNQAMLRRSLSETATTKSATTATAITHRRSVDQRPKKVPMLMRSATSATGRGTEEEMKKHPHPQPQPQQRAGMRKAVEKLFRSIFRGKDRRRKRENDEMDGRGANEDNARASSSRSRRASLADLLLPGGV